LVISCNTPLDGFSDIEGPSMPGTGKARLTINNRNYNRTILPLTLPTIKYLLVLKGDTGVEDFYKSITSSTTTVDNIPIGDYVSAQVFAYTGDDLVKATFNTYVNVAIGESDIDITGFEIEEGVITPLGAHTVKLYAPGAAPAPTATPTDNGKGGFSYKIKDSTSSRLDSAEFVVLGRGGIAPLNSGNPYTITANDTEIFIGGNPDDVVSPTPYSIPSGYYNVFFTLEDNEATANVVKFLEILHVYKGLNSLYENIFTPGIFPEQANPPKYGEVTITINGVSTAPTNVVGVLSGGDSNVTVGASNTLFVDVEIKKSGDSTEVRNLIFTVGTPASGITLDGWYNTIFYPDLSAAKLGPGNGITFNSAGQTFTISFDTTNGDTGTGFPLALNGSSNDIQLILVYDGASFTIPLIKIKFVD